MAVAARRGRRPRRISRSCRTRALGADWRAGPRRIRRQCARRNRRACSTGRVARVLSPDRRQLTLSQRLRTRHTPARESSHPRADPCTRTSSRLHDMPTRLMQSCSRSSSRPLAWSCRAAAATCGTAPLRRLHARAAVAARPGCARAADCRRTGAAAARPHRRGSPVRGRRWPRRRRARARRALKFRAALPIATLMAAHIAANLPPDVRRATARPVNRRTRETVGRPRARPLTRALQPSQRPIRRP